MKIFTIDNRVNDIDLSKLMPLVEWHHHAQFFNGAMGREHYRLFAYISHQVDSGETIYDIGTFAGYSALALAANPTIQVVSYDLEDHIKDAVPSVKQYPNITLKLADCTQPDEITQLAKASVILLDVDPHDGVQEPQIFKALQTAGFRGLLFLDDIHLNEPMNRFWESIQLKKYDITKYGHWSGTGVVVFDSTAYDVKII